MRATTNHPFVRWSCDGGIRHRIARRIIDHGRRQPRRSASWRLSMWLAGRWTAAEHLYWRTFIRREDRFGETDWTPLP